MSDDTSSHVRVSHLYDELLSYFGIFLAFAQTAGNVIKRRDGRNIVDDTDRPTRDARGLLVAPICWVGYIASIVFIRKSTNNHRLRFSDISEKIYVLVSLSRFILGIMGTGGCCVL